MISSAISYAQQNKAQAEVAAVVESLRKAMVDADQNTLEKLLASELSYGHSGGKVEAKSSFMEALASGKSDFVTLTISDQTITVTDNTAIVRHHLSGDTNDGGKTNTINLSILLVWQKQNGEWKLLARQAVKI